jgi:hypothetical protein
MDDHSAGKGIRPVEVFSLFLKMELRDNIDYHRVNKSTKVIEYCAQKSAFFNKINGTKYSHFSV